MRYSLHENVKKRCSLVFKGKSAQCYLQDLRSPISITHMMYNESSLEYELSFSLRWVNICGDSD
jgi:hypothetical protein